MGERVALDSGSGLTGYRSDPTGEPLGGVVMVQEAGPFGQSMRDAADRMASWGFVVLAPELASTGSMVRCMARAFRDLRAGSGPTFEAIETARRRLVAELGEKPIVIAGFCLGGGYALVLGVNGDYAATVANYGDLPRHLDDLERSCPIVASYGGRDLAFAGKGHRLADALERSSVPHDVKIYPEAGHSFLNSVDEIPWYAVPVAKLVLRAAPDSDAASDAWERIRLFLATQLSGD